MNKENQDENSPKDKTKKPSHSRKTESKKEKTKVIVRRLPPNLPEPIFYESIKDWTGNINWSCYFPGKLASS